MLVSHLKTKKHFSFQFAFYPSILPLTWNYVDWSHSYSLLCMKAFLSSNTDSSLHWLTRSKIDWLIFSCISYHMSSSPWCHAGTSLGGMAPILAPLVAWLPWYPPGCLARMAAPGGMSSLVAFKVAWLPPGGWWWVLVATSGSCGRWVLVGVMQIPDTGHGPQNHSSPHSPAPATCLPCPMWKLVPFQIKLNTFGNVEKLKSAHISCLHPREVPPPVSVY